MIGSKIIRIVAAAAVLVAAGVLAPATASAAPVDLAVGAASCGAGMAPTSVTAAEQQQMLALHNALRAKYGSEPLTWDDTLAACAQDWANQQAKTDNQPVHRPADQFGDTGYGENAYSSFNAPADTNAPSMTPQGAMGSWGGEERNFSATAQCAQGTDCGHFTQVVWSTTTKIGCGKAYVPDRPSPGAIMVYWDCNYFPAGNNGGSPFTAGGANPGPGNQGADNPGQGGGNQGTGNQAVTTDCSNSESTTLSPADWVSSERCLINGERAKTNPNALRLSQPLDAAALAFAQAGGPADVKQITTAGYCSNGAVTSWAAAEADGAAITPKSAFDIFMSSARQAVGNQQDLGLAASGQRFEMVLASCA